MTPTTQTPCILLFLNAWSSIAYARRQAQAARRQSAAVTVDRETVENGRQAIEAQEQPAQEAHQ